MSSLKLSKVVFNEIEHTYTLDGKTLSGVTALLKRQLFADKYSGISEATLAKAAERGNAIHRQIEMYETFGGDNFDTEVESYIRLKQKNELNTVATEWLVSDNKHVASSIDVVYEKKVKQIDDDTWVSVYYLCDIKTTSSLDMEYLSWQLSIYKYLLLLDNPGIRIGGLLACWLPREQYGRAKMVTVDEKPMEWVKGLIECDARGEQWEQPDIPTTKESNALVVPVELTETIAEFLRYEKAAKEMKERLKDMLEQHGVKKWECDAFTATITPAGKTVKFDSKSFAEKHPDLYDEYMRETERRSSIRVTLK